MPQRIYCSLDIETSDFDPANGDVLEVGMVFFEVHEHGVKVLREYQTVFKPSREVPARILALTGIKQEELDSAPLFREKSEEIQEMVNGAIILGHNISFDIKFLEGFGIKFSGRKVDTLDLAQIFLPTLKSYNLEALMNYLGVDHKDAHRALADAKACVTVLEKLLGYHSTFPPELQQKMLKLLAGNAISEELQALLQTNFPDFTVAEQQHGRVNLADSADVSDSLKEDMGIVSFPLGVDYYSYVYGSLKKTRQHILFVVPDKKIAYALWRQGIAEPIFENDDLFNEKAFEKNLKLADTAEQQVFFAKMLVWKYLNWQTRALVDVNFSFAGGQFRGLVNFGSRKKSVEAEVDGKVVVVDYAAFIGGHIPAGLKSRKVLILDVNTFESTLTRLSSGRVSWSDFIYTFKQAEAGDDWLAQIDLYFGLASMWFRKLEPEQSTVLIDKEKEETDVFAQFAKATESFCGKVEKFNSTKHSKLIDEYVASLKKFLLPDANTVRWVEMYDGKLSLMASPIDLHEIAKKKLGIYKKIVFTCSLGSDSLVGYFSERLGLVGYKHRVIGQQVLRPSFRVLIQPEQMFPGKLSKLVSSLEAPAAVLLPSSAALRDFYEAEYRNLQEKYKVYAQSYSGGTNKILDNFSINENSLFIATDRFVLRQSQRKLKVKNLIITRLPFEQFNHPLFAVQAARYQNQFIDFNIPRALYNFHTIINFFYSDELKNIYILDAKIKKEYGKYFLDYLKSLPFVRIE